MRPWPTEPVVISDMCREIPRKWGSGRIEEMQRGSEAQRDGRDVSMATKGSYRWTGHLSQTGGDRRLLKMT